MNRTYREGVDIEVAFRSPLKGARAAGEPPQNAGAGADLPASRGNVPPPRAADASSGRYARLLQAPLRWAFRGIKPILRPFASRVRRSLMTPLHEDVQRTHAALQEIRNLQAVLQEDLRRVHAVLALEAATTRERMLADLQSAQLEAAKDGRAAAERMEHDARALREAIARDLSSSSRTMEGAVAREHERTNAVLLAALRQMHDSAASPQDRLYTQLDRVEQYALLAARRIAVSCGDSTLVRTDVGYVLCPSGDHATLARLIETGETERGTRLVIEKVLTTGDTFIDVGANLGLHTLAGCRALQGRGRAIAVEPYEPTARLLRRTLWINGVSDLVDVRETAAADRAGRHLLFLGATTGHHSLFPLSAGGPAPDPSAVDVAVATLDDIAGDAPVALVKIDVEGAELLVLSGAKRLIERNQEIAVIAEFGQAHLARTGVGPEDWLAAFARMGLVCRRIDEETGAVSAVTADALRGVATANLLFARPHAPVWSRVEKQT